MRRRGCCWRAALKGGQVFRRGGPEGVVAVIGDRHDVAAVALGRGHDLGHGMTTVGKLGVRVRVGLQPYAAARPGHLAHKPHSRPSRRTFRVAAWEGLRFRAAPADRQREGNNAYPSKESANGGSNHRITFSIEPAAAPAGHAENVATMVLRHQGRGWTLVSHAASSRFKRATSSGRCTERSVRSPGS
jgi:hypothetical protein